MNNLQIVLLGLSCGLLLSLNIGILYVIKLLCELLYGKKESDFNIKLKLDTSLFNNSMQRAINYVQKFRERIQKQEIKD